MPLLIRGPSIAAGAQVEARWPNADLAPTMLELAGAPSAARARAADRRHLARSRRLPARRDAGRAVLIEGRDNVAGSRHGLQGPLLRRRAHRPLRLLRASPRPLRQAAPRGSGSRSAPGGRPSASSTTSIATPTSCATSTATGATRDAAPRARGRARARSSDCAGAECVLDADPRPSRATRGSVDGSRHGERDGPSTTASGGGDLAVAALSPARCRSAATSARSSARAAEHRPDHDRRSDARASIVAMPRVTPLLIDQGTTFVEQHRLVSALLSVARDLDHRASTRTTTA